MGTGCNSRTFPETVKQTTEHETHVSSIAAQAVRRSSGQDEAKSGDLFAP